MSNERLKVAAAQYPVGFFSDWPSYATHIEKWVAEAAHQPASQVVRELMREFVQRQREAREYDQFLRRKVEIARSSIHARLGRSNEEVEADLAYRKDFRVNE